MNDGTRSVIMGINASAEASKNPHHASTELTNQVMISLVEANPVLARALNDRIDSYTNKVKAYKQPLLEGAALVLEVYDREHDRDVVSGTGALAEQDFSLIFENSGLTETRVSGDADSLSLALNIPRLPDTLPVLKSLVGKASTRLFPIGVYKNFFNQGVVLGRELAKASFAKQPPK